MLRAAVAPLRRFCAKATPLPRPPRNPAPNEWIASSRMYTLIKGGIAVFVGLGALSVADPVYTLYKATQCDLPDLPPRSNFIDRKDRIEALQEWMDGPGGQFFVVTGIPGIGKTRLVTEAGRSRGEGVIYVDAGLCSSSAAIEETINRKYGSPFLSFWSLLGNKRATGWDIVTKAADWFYWWKKKQLVVIIDHIDKLPDNELLRVLGFAKSSADHMKLSTWLVGSDGFPVLRRTSAFWTRGIELKIPPPSPREVKTLLERSLSPKYHKYIPEIVYLTGCNLGLLWTCIAVASLGRSADDMISLLGEKERMLGEKETMKMEVRDFWVKLLESGPRGVEMVQAMRGDNCVVCLKSRVYFRDGVCRDYFAQELGKTDLLKDRTIQSYCPL